VSEYAALVFVLIIWLEFTRYDISGGISQISGGISQIFNSKLIILKRLTLITTINTSLTYLLHGAESFLGS